MLDNNTGSGSASIIWWEEDVSPIQWEDKTIEWSDNNITPNLTIEWSDIVITSNLTIEWWEELED